jgi:hypothetical protein
MPWQEVAAGTTTTSSWDGIYFYDQYVPGGRNYSDIVAAMEKVQGFRAGDWQWFGAKLLDRVRLGRLNRLCFDVNKSEQRAKAPRLQGRERKVMFKPRATSCRKWTTGRPRK